MSADEHLREAARHLTLCKTKLENADVVKMVLDALTLLGCAGYLLEKGRGGKIEDRR